MQVMDNYLRRSLHMKHFDYDTKEFPFKQHIEQFFGCRAEDIHKHMGDFKVFDRENDQSTLAHKVFYANFSKELKDLYVDFVNKVIAPIVKQEFYYQLIPTFRIGLPGNRFVGEFHKDSKYNHLPYELNFNLGICGYEGEASLMVEDSEGSELFNLLECPYGKIFSFDHISCLHGSKPNPNDITMVSFDFRVALKALYFETTNQSVNMNRRFRPGEYFSKEIVTAS